jgi:ankyrin repeat protein
LVKCPSGNQNINAIIQTLPTVNVNQQDLQGNTALMHIIFTASPYWVNPQVIIQDILDAGANPELANYEGLTPLAAAQQTRNRRIIDLIQNAINKKHERKQDKS